jgi:hypothetical protein
MTFTISRGVNLAELRTALRLRPMSEFDPDKPARIYDNLNEGFFDWDLTSRMSGIIRSSGSNGRTSAHTAIATTHSARLAIRASHVARPERRQSGFQQNRSNPNISFPV